MKLIQAMLGSIGLTIGVAANAALPTGVTTAITTATADGQEMGGLWLAFSVGVAVLFFLARKV